MFQGTITNKKGLALPWNGDNLLCNVNHFQGLGLVYMRKILGVKYCSIFIFIW